MEPARRVVFFLREEQQRYWFYSDPDGGRLRRKDWILECEGLLTRFRFRFRKREGGVPRLAFTLCGRLLFMQRLLFSGQTLWLLPFEVIAGRD